MVQAKDLEKLIYRLIGLIHRLDKINPLLIRHRECSSVRRALEEAKEASTNRVLGQMRRLERQRVKGNATISDLVKQTISFEKKFQTMIQDKLEQLDKREQDPT